LWNLYSGGAYGRGAHGKERRHDKGGRKQQKGACTVRGGAHGKGGAHGEGRARGKGAHGKGAWAASRARKAKGARTGKGHAPKRGAHTPRGTYAHAPNNGPWPHATWLAWGAYVHTHHWGREWRARKVPRRRVYMSYPPHLKLPSLLFLAPYLAPTKCFVWDFGS
jgi:hypothetical protein